MFICVSGPNGERLKCCSISFNEFHEECFPIGVTDNNFKHEKKCQEYVRSATAPRIGCTLGKLKLKAECLALVFSVSFSPTGARTRQMLSSFASAQIERETNFESANLNSPQAPGSSWTKRRPTLTALLCMEIRTRRPNFSGPTPRDNCVLLSPPAANTCCRSQRNPETAKIQTSMQ